MKQANPFVEYEIYAIDPLSGSETLIAKIEFGMFGLSVTPIMLTGSGDYTVRAFKHAKHGCFARLYYASKGDKVEIGDIYFNPDYNLIALDHPIRVEQV